MITNATKIILNNLRCPLCKSQIDMISVTSINYLCNFGCAYDSDHFMVKIENFDGFSKITYQIVNIYDHKNKYKIIKQNFGSIIETIIKVYTTDAEGREQFSFKEKRIELKFDAFNFENFNKEKALGRIKNLFLFQ